MYLSVLVNTNLNSTDTWLKLTKLYHYNCVCCCSWIILIIVRFCSITTLVFLYNVPRTFPSRCWNYPIYLLALLIHCNMTSTSPRKWGQNIVHSFIFFSIAMITLQRMCGQNFTVWKKMRWWWFVLILITWTRNLTLSSRWFQLISSIGLILWFLFSSVQIT